MRAKAISLRCDATVLESSFADLPDRADAIDFRAHAGDRWRHNIRSACRSARTYAEQARALAKRLDDAADDLEDDLAAWGRAQERWADERREAATRHRR